MELLEKKTKGPNGAPFPFKTFARGMKAQFLKMLNEIDGVGNFEWEKISLIEGWENAMMNRANRLDRGDPTGSNFLGESKLPKWSSSHQVKCPIQNTKQAPMRVMTYHDPFLITDGDGKVGCPALDISGAWLVSLQKMIRIIDFPLKEKVFIFVFEQKKGFPFLNERKRGWDRDILNHRSLR
jgi:hypothetical protein